MRQKKKHFSEIINHLLYMMLIFWIIYIKKIIYFWQKIQKLFIFNHGKIFG